MGPLERTLLLADQTNGFIGLLVLLAVVTALACRAARFHRWLHRTAWILFGAWILLVACVPYLRQLDQTASWFYSLRGIPYGLLLASMLTIGRGRQTAG